MKKQHVATDGCPINDEYCSLLQLFTFVEKWVWLDEGFAVAVSKLCRFAGIGRFFSIVERKDGKITGVFVVLAVETVLFEPPFNVTVVALVELNGNGCWHMLRGATVRLCNSSLLRIVDDTPLVGWAVFFVVLPPVDIIPVSVVFFILLRFERCSCRVLIQSKSLSLTWLFSLRAVWNNSRNVLY